MRLYAIFAFSFSLFIAVSMGEFAQCEPNTTPHRQTDPALNHSAPLETQAIPPRSSPRQEPFVAQHFNKTPKADAIKSEIASGPVPASDQQQKEHDALVAFYKGRDFSPMWISKGELNLRAHILLSEFQNAGAWGLKPEAFKLSNPLDSGKTHHDLSERDLAKTELELTRKALKYARFARGGRIMQPAKILNSNLDRKPKLIDPNLILTRLAAAQDVDLFLQSLHPKHLQFQLLRQAFLARRAKTHIKLPRKREGFDVAELLEKQKKVLRTRLGLRAKLSYTDAGEEEKEEDRLNRQLIDALKQFQSRHDIAPADGNLTRQTVHALNKRPKVSIHKLLANMEEWRWMWEDMGDVYVLANIPEYMLHVIKNGKDIHTERIVVGEIGKQSSIFTRRLKHIVLRPMWRVPESIKVRELWPNLRRGGSMFRKFGLQLETKDGKRLDYRKLDWSKQDIRNYEVVQPPGRKSVMGVVKFSFPSQHTIFMHDTPDKYMFNRRQRTLSHGCLRVRNPVKLADILLLQDKGWSAKHINKLIKSGPPNNAIKIESRIPIHLTYFTAWAKKDGSVRVYRDIYGHEKRITLALQGHWDRINKGRNHLAAVQPVRVSSRRRSARKRRSKHTLTPNDYVRAAFGGAL